MQTHLIKKYSNTQQGQEADSILRSCVHCGFCTATCPTYQLLGDELDSPRGRIYLIKQFLEGHNVSKKTQTHLDRCLTCRSCETTCPSGVKYGRLIDIGREMLEQHVKRNNILQLKRYLLRQIIPYPKRFSFLLKLACLGKPFLPASIRKKIPARQNSKRTNNPQQHSRKMLILEGCAQSSVTPDTNNATNSILNKLDIEVISAESAGCCGAVSHHLSAHEEGLEFVRRNIDAWWPHIEQGIETIVITASGCGVHVKDYETLLKHDQHYAEKARHISQLTKDISEVIANETLPLQRLHATNTKVAFHSPCTLQHGQQLDGVVESILTRAGYELTDINDKHLCCGSAGTYSILQPELSQQLLNNKITSLQANKPDIIATANIGCQLHIATKAHTPVKHWIELLDEIIKS
ncbi:MAG: glycolate oxidase subunit GlcF [Gammaproteobacteria bacterium]|nr:glycolate oxidase subunit GlcF [Gammaproteobacteria bacterium]